MLNKTINPMKKTIISTFALLIFAGYGMAGNEKTVANLKDAFKGESTASAKYAAFAEQAKKEKFTEIATMFMATSKAEAIHAANHKAVLEKLGQKVEPVKPVFTTKTTKENLEDAIKGETYEMTTMYPGFIASSKEEGVENATKSFRWAMDTEKKHQVIYQNALTALSAGKVASLPKIYWVCPKCGNTFDVSKPEAQCPFCSTASSKYIKFDK
jgi:rubrerythrin